MRLEATIREEGGSTRQGGTSSSPSHKRSTIMSLWALVWGKPRNINPLGESQRMAHGKEIHAPQRDG